MLTMLLATLLSAGALLGYEVITHRQQMSNDLRTQADLIAQATVAALVFNDPKVAEENLALLKARPSIQAAAVFGRDGTPVATYVREADQPVPVSAVPVSEEGAARFDGSTMEMSRGIENNDEAVGTVYLRAQHDLWSRLVSHAILLGLIGAGSLGFAFYVFGRLQAHITRPLVKMTEIAHEVSVTRDWSLRAPGTEYRDVTVLVDAFNNMLAECESRTTELERQMAIREKAEHDLRMADRRKDEFLATLAHELRNPLAPMTNCVAVMERAIVSRETRDKAVATLGRQVRHMVRLIDDLLDASRIATGKLSLDRRPLALTAVLAEAVQVARPLATQSGLELALSLPNDPLHVDGDVVRLSQVISNLLNNACRYTPAGGRVDVIALQDGEAVQVAIRDSGIGVEPAMQERIFGLFEQADKSLERGAAGLGIGLTLARQLVQLHGGTLSVSSQGLGHGSCFTVRLPLLRNVPDALPAPVRAAGGVDSLTVLIADDNVDLVESMALILRSEGCEVDTAHDGDAALDAAVKRVPDIALLDIGMPGRNGYDVARQLRSQVATRRIYLVAITGWGQDADRLAASAAGFDKHLVKPVNPDELISMLGDRVKVPRAGEPKPVPGRQAAGIDD
ncbi:MAG TPA: ATP-binding protein, partial [Rubrivivax sp.]|nr:ATP-binding protein [Rubrivivax sp.]